MKTNNDMRNIHVLPTDKPSAGYVLGKCIKDLLDVKIGQFTKTYYLMFDEKYFQAQNIYITSNEEIKEGDWCLDEDGLKKCTAHAGAMNHYFEKIILTTDQDLIKDGVQAIDDEFLEWFVKNPSCDFAHLGFTSIIGDSETKRTYKIIIPKEEPTFENSINNTMNIMSIANSMFGKKEEPKQEILEEAAERWVFETNGHKWSNNDDSAGDNFGSFVAGSKWRSDNSYTRDELKEAYSMGRLGKSIAEFNERFKN